MGRWWQMEKTPTVSELPGKCWSSFYYRDVANVNKVKMRMDYVTRLWARIYVNIFLFLHARFPLFRGKRWSLTLRVEIWNDKCVEYFTGPTLPTRSSQRSLCLIPYTILRCSCMLFQQCHVRPFNFNNELRSFAIDMTLTFYNLHSGMKKKYRVLATDYENFSIEYMCNVNMMGKADGKTF